MENLALQKFNEANAKLKIAIIDFNNIVDFDAVFYAAESLLEVCSVFGQLSEELAKKKKYANFCIPVGGILNGFVPSDFQLAAIQALKIETEDELVTMAKLIHISEVSPVGTIAYLNEEESLLLRVRKGWQYISMGKFVPLPTPTTTTTIPPPTTLKKSAPSAAENMIPKIPRVPGLRLVALNEPLTGNMGGIQRVDSACYRQARQAGLRGIFRAFLASRVQKIDKIVRPPYRGYPVINLRGEMLFRTWNDLFHGRGASELSPARQQRHDIYSFNNRNIFNDIVWPQKVVWHGAGPSGQRQLDSYCDAWTSSDAKTLGVAASFIASSPSHQQQQQQTGGGGGGKLLAQDKFSCQNRFIVLCIEATSQVVASGWVKRVVEHFEQKTI